MSVCLTKGRNTSLTKEAPNLTIVAVAVGWDVRVTPSADFDLDASAIACGDDRTILSDKHFVFFHNRSSPDGPIQHTGDNLDGSGDGDGYGDGDGDTINVDLASTPPNITKIFFPVSIYDGDKHNQTFGQVDNAYIRVVDTASGAEPARYDLSEHASTETAMIFGELYRHSGEWKFHAGGQGYASGLERIARDYGVDVDVDIDVDVDVDRAFTAVLAGTVPSATDPGSEKAQNPSG